MGDTNQTTDKDVTLPTTLKKVRRRIALQRWVAYTVRGLFASASIACVWVILTRLFPQLGDPIFGIAGILIVGYLIAVAWTVYKRPGLVDAALQADERLGLKERLTTSLELADRQDAMSQAVHADAKRQLQGLNLRNAFPLVTTGVSRWVYVPLIVLGLAYMLFPELDLGRHQERQAEAVAEQRAVSVKVERIKSDLKSLKDDPQAAEGPLADLAVSLADLARDLEAAALTDKQAMARLTSLADQLRKQRQGLAEENPTPKLAGNMDKLGLTREFARALQEGRMSDAVQKAKELAKKMRDGDLSEKEMKDLQKDLKKLSDMLGGKNSQIGEALSQALAKASEAMNKDDMQGALEAMKEAELSLEDIASILEQMEKMDTMMASLSEWKGEFMGASKYCRACGSKKDGMGECSSDGSCCGNCSVGGATGACGSCSGMGSDLGLRGPGQGQGNRIGELPDLDGEFQPTAIKGPLTKGKMLADILQRTAPEPGEEATVEYISGSFVQLKQEAEQALTQEEIPAGSKEFVRQYFGSLEPESP